jgi:hypothetical protein
MIKTSNLFITECKIIHGIWVILLYIVMALYFRNFLRTHKYLSAKPN